MAPLTIDIVSDVLCPWCWLGKHNLARALATRPELAFERRWHPFQLDPTIPEEGADHHARLARKFGGPGVLAAAHARLTEMGEKVGLAYHFEKITRTPNSLSGHVLVKAARTHGGAALEDAVVDRLFAAFFGEGVDLTAPGAWAAQAEAAGLPRDVAEDALADGGLRSAVAAEAREWAQRGVTGVPTFVFAGKWAVSGAQPIETFQQVLAKLAPPPPGAPP